MSTARQVPPSIDETSALSGDMPIVLRRKSPVIAQLREAAGFFFKIEKLTFGN
jgi:hypothetical protein